MSDFVLVSFHNSSSRMSTSAVAPADATPVIHADEAVADNAPVASDSTVSKAVPLIDINCAHCANAAMHYRLLYSDYMARMEELRIMRSSQAEQVSLVNELHHLRSLFEQQRQQLQSMVPPSSSREANGGLFEYLKVLSDEHKRRVDDMRAKFDSKLARIHAEHAEQLKTAQDAARVVDVSKVEEVQEELRVVKSDYAAALEREVKFHADMAAVNVRLEKAEAAVIEKEEEFKSLTCTIADAASEAADESVRRDREVWQMQQKLDVAQQLVASLKASLEDARRGNEVLEGVQSELTRRLKAASDQLQECQRANFTEQQEILKKRDALQVRLFDTLQTVSNFQRRMDDMEAKLAAQEPYVQVARDIQALLLHLPDESCPALVPPKPESPQVSAHGKKKKGTKK